MLAGRGQPLSACHAVGMCVRLLWCVSVCGGVVRPVAGALMLVVGVACWSVLRLRLPVPAATHCPYWQLGLRCAIYQCMCVLLVEAAQCASV